MLNALIVICVCVCLGSLGVCTIADIWEVWSPADAGGLSLSAGVPLEVCIRRAAGEDAPGAGDGQHHRALR